MHTHKLTYPLFYIYLAAQKEETAVYKTPESCLTVSFYLKYIKQQYENFYILIKSNSVQKNINFLLGFPLR